MDPSSQIEVGDYQFLEIIKYFQHFTYVLSGVYEMEGAWIMLLCEIMMLEYL